jgi:hypothetical protein
MDIRAMIPHKSKALSLHKGKDKMKYGTLFQLATTTSSSFSIPSLANNVLISAGISLQVVASSLDQA